MESEHPSGASPVSFNRRKTNVSDFRDRISITKVVIN